MDRPNLLIIMVDQMEARLLDRDHGLPFSLPNLEALRGRSAQFPHAYCPAPICTPTRASFQLGQAVSRHGVRGNGRPMPADTPTLPERLQAAGYATGYVGKWHLDRDNPRGWSVFDEVSRSYDGDFGQRVMSGIDAPHQGAAPFAEDDHLDGCVARRGREVMRELQATGRPWAAMVSFFGPHAPYWVPEAWHERVDPASVPLPDDFDAPFVGKPEVQRTFRCRAWGQAWSEDKWRAIRAAYYAYCLMLDHFIGQLLTEAGDDVAVLFLSDHGEMNGHLRMIYKGPMMYEQLVRVPVLLRSPRQREGVADDRLIQIQDLTATLLGLAGCGLDDRVDGRDLFDSDSPSRDHVVSEFYEANWVKPIVEQRVSMLRDRRWKYVLTEGQGEELYDMEAALPEVENLAALPAHHERLTDYRRRLAEDVPWVGGVAAT